jgi:hypothetical protein
MEPVTITIERSRWGYGDQGGALRRVDTKKQCCLGFACEQAGYTDLTRRSFPQQALHPLAVSLDEVPPTLHPFVRLVDDPYTHIRSSQLSFDLASINDSLVYTSQEDREADLIKRAAQDNVTFKFVD